ncbi:MAG: hypothetical protein M1351_02175 [Candidatus Thermoplasmatota archaeon]|nr:hypothetical protein [Candidatus Thermoplasmatota archaeon]
MNELRKSLLISIPIAAACLYYGIVSPSMTLVVAGIVVAFVGAVIPAVSGRAHMKTLKMTIAVVVTAIIIIFAIGIMQMEAAHDVAPQSTQPGTVIATIMAQNATFAYAPNGTVSTVSEIVHITYGMVYGGIEFNISNGTAIVGSWSSTSQVAAIIVPLQYMHNVSVLGKQLSIEKPSLSGRIDMSFGTAVSVSSVSLVLMFFPLPGQSGTVTFTQALVLEDV